MNELNSDTSPQVAGAQAPPPTQPAERAKDLEPQSHSWKPAESGGSKAPFGTADDGDVETLKLILDELTARVSRQIDSTKGIDTKAGVLAGFAATAATFLAGRNVQLGLAVAAYVSYAATFVFALAALAVTAYKDVPDARVFVNEYAREPKIKALRDLVVERAKVLEHNAKKQSVKVWRWWIAVAALGLGVLFTVFATAVGHN